MQRSRYFYSYLPDWLIDRGHAQGFYFGAVEAYDSQQQPGTFTPTVSSYLTTQTLLLFNPARLDLFQRQPKFTASILVYFFKLLYTFVDFFTFLRSTAICSRMTGQHRQGVPKWVVRHRLSILFTFVVNPIPRNNRLELHMGLYTGGESRKKRAKMTRSEMTV
jgi:hypothetical protein